MRAAVMHAFAEPLSLETAADPAPEPDGAVVQVRATGVCRSDWHAWMGHDASIVLPHVGGHELAGEVVAVGPEVRGFAPGDRVTVPFYCGSGRCEPCRQGETQLCERDRRPGFTLWARSPTWSHCRRPTSISCGSRTSWTTSTQPRWAAAS